MRNSGAKNKIIFFGNGPLAKYALAVLERECQVVFHAHDRDDLDEAVRLKQENPEYHGVLASFGVMIPARVLEAFEPEGILNIHPSLLPLYRGASPIESAILNGDNAFGVSVMKLVSKMDAGPILNQATLEDPPLNKEYLYQTLAEIGAKMVVSILNSKKAVKLVVQDEKKATFCSKFEKKDGILTPETDTAEQTLRKIVAFQGFPKAKYTFFGKNCAILDAHIANAGETALLPLECADKQIVAVDRLQPDGRKVMDAKSFLNGYGK
ncbi:methionyl-tRNA formyltransferase [Candidatus Saccharibacteria bacterium]|nr:methionyl-tRNA formyltransferase [Candidatus Saccharibacteria bacterium]